VNDAHFEKAAGFAFEGEREHAAATSLRWGREATGIFCFFFNYALLRGCGVFVFVFVCDGQMATTALPPPHSPIGLLHDDERDFRAASVRFRNLALSGGRSELSCGHNDVAVARAQRASAGPTPTRAIISQTADLPNYNLAQTALQALRALSRRSRLAEAVTNTCRHTASFRPIPVVAVAGERVSGANFAVSSFALALALAFACETRGGRCRQCECADVVAQ